MKSWFKTVVFIFITASIILAFLIPIDHIPALGNRARNLFFHVPLSWAAVIAFLISMIYSVKYLKTKDNNNDIVAYSAAETGFVFCMLGLLTGALWSKVDWGVFLKFNDPRVMSMLMLLAVYAAYLILRGSIDDIEKRAKLSSVYLIFAFVTVPFFIFIMPRIFPGLHPGSSDDIDSPGGGPVVGDLMSMNMRLVFYFSAVSFVLLFFFILNLKIRSERLTQRLSAAYD